MIKARRLILFQRDPRFKERTNEPQRYIKIKLADSVRERTG